MKVLSEYLALLQKLIKVNSFTDYKIGVDTVGDLIQKELSFMKVERFPHEVYGDLLVFSSKVREDSLPMILLSGHADTVHKSNDLNPLRIENNRLYGPGSNDMKGGLTVIVGLLKELYKTGRLKNIIFTLVPDEEKGSKSHLDTLKGFYQSVEYGLVFEESTLEATPWITDYKTHRRAIVRSRKGFGGAEIVIKTKGGHSGAVFQKENRHSANLMASKLLLQLESLSDYGLNSTVNPGFIRGGDAINAIASECKMLVDYRVVDANERDRMIHEFENIVESNKNSDYNISLKWLYDIPPMQRSSNTDKWIRRLKVLSEEMGIELIPEDRMGGSDANQIATHGVIVLDGFGPQGEDEHTNNEFLYIDSILPSKEFALKTVLDLFKK